MALTSLSRLWNTLSWLVEVAAHLLLLILLAVEAAVLVGYLAQLGML
jgi:hypothetical protein